MTEDNKITYDKLEIRFDDSINANGFSAGESLRRINYQQKEKLELIPTADEEIRTILILLNEPETVTSEDAFSRRERLSELLFMNRDYMETFEAHLRKKQSQNLESDNLEGDEEEEFYTPASEELIKARKFMIKYTNERSRERLMRESKDATTYDMSRVVKKRREINRQIMDLELVASQIGSSRPISQSKLSPNDQYIATANWDGGIVIFQAQSLDVVCSLDIAHKGKVGGIDWSTDGKMIVSGAEEGLVKLFSVENEQIQELLALKGHERRVAGTAFHPSQNFVASASFDMTWRLWDTKVGKELLLQEGHGKEVYCLDFQTDGSLLCSAGLDHCGMLWDIRCGKSLLTLKGHVKPIYSVSWSPDGHRVATGAGDGTIKVWDMRKATEAYTILAHNSIVSNVTFDRQHGDILISSGYDRKVNVYSCDNWIKLHSLEGHTDKVLCADISKDSDFIVSSSWDRSIKIWKADKYSRVS